MRHWAGVLLAALALRALWALWVPVVPLSDSVAYDTFARNLVEYGVYGWTPQTPYAFWPPGTSFLYAAVYWLFGVGYLNIVVLNLLMSAALIVTSARVAARLWGPRVGLATAWVLALWPTLIMFTTILASELPFMLFTLAALDVWIARRGSPLVRGALAGVLLGAAALVRPLALALPVIYAAAELLRASTTRESMAIQARMVVLSVLAMACVIAPWTWRNVQLYHAPVLISTNGGITLWMGNAPGTRGDYLPIPERLRGLSDYEQSVVLGREAKRIILQDPLGFATRSARKLLLLYGNESIGVTWNGRGIAEAIGPGAVLPIKRFTQISWALIFLSALAGVWMLAKRHGWRQVLLSPPLLMIGFYSVVYAVVVAQDRYHLSFAPQIAMLVAASLAQCGRRSAVAPRSRADEATATSA